MVGLGPDAEAVVAALCMSQQMGVAGVVDVPVEVEGAPARGYSRCSSFLPEGAP